MMKVKLIKNIKQWRRVEVLKDYQILYRIVLNMISYAMDSNRYICISIICHNRVQKGGENYVIAQSFMVYSILTVITLLLVAGFLDR